MSARWHLLTGEYPPATGGIARFTAVMAQSLASRGEDVHVWVPGRGVETPGVTLHLLPDRFGRRARRLLETDIHPGDVVLLQYTPNALGCRGANLRFCAWLDRLARRRDVRVVFHEPFFYFARWSMARNVLALVQRLMAVLLLRSARTVYLSTASWQPLLRPYALRGSIEWRTLPISVGEIAMPAPAEVSAVRARYAGQNGSLVGHFGSYAPELRPVLRAAIAALMDRMPGAAVLCIGHGSREFVEGDLVGYARVAATGSLAEVDVPAHLRACDLLMAPFGEGVTTRRTSLITALALGCPVVTTEGRYTEPEWRSDAAAVLVPAGDASAMARACEALLADEPSRRRLTNRAIEVYQHRFSRRALLAALDLEDPAAAGSR